MQDIQIKIPENDSTAATTVRMKRELKRALDVAVALEQTTQTQVIEDALMGHLGLEYKESK